MKNLSYWAFANPWAARVMIVLAHLLLAFAGIRTGLELVAIGRPFPTFLLIGLAGALLWIGAIILVILLGLLLIAGLAYLVAGLACNLSCGGNEGAAILVVLIGIGLGIAIVIAMIRIINRIIFVEQSIKGKAP